MIAGHTVIAFHGCDIVTRDDLVSGRLPALRHSQNRYDWLGPGSYFFEGDETRALSFATASAENPTRHYTSKPIATPAVVGVVLSIKHCLDMTTQEGLTVYTQVYQQMQLAAELEGKPMPQNEKARDDDADVLLRQLDNAVFTQVHELNAELEISSYQAVRGAFEQGDELVPGSAFRKDSHIQIALRDDTCIIGWFLPKGTHLLDVDAYVRAKEALAAATSARTKNKPRVRK